MTKSGKVYGCIFGVLLLLMGICSMLLIVFKMAMMRSVLFALFSIIANTAVIALIHLAGSVVGIKLKKEHYIIIACIFALFSVYTMIFVFFRSFVYFWDYSNYVVRQINIEQAFRKGIPVGIQSISDTLYGDYTNFINIFTEFPFFLTARTGDCYVVCQLVNVFLPLLLVISLLTIKLGELFQVTEQNKFFILAIATLITLPIFRTSFLLGQPDWLGLVFAFLIVLLTVDYDFTNWEPLRCVLLIISTVAIIFIRRWYLYFVVSYYAVYGCSLLIRMIAARKDRETNRKRFLHLAVFVMAAAVILAIIFYPMIRHILQYDYRERYAEYNAGGFPVEISAQFSHLGIITVVVLCGLFSGKTKKQKPYLLAMLVGLLVAIFLFTRVQNMNPHHVLLLFPFYYLLFCAGAFVLSHAKKKKLSAAFCILYIVHGILDPFGMTSVFLKAEDKILPQGEFVHVEKEVFYRSDIEQLKQVATFIDQHCQKGEIVYFVPHDYLYNPDMLINIRLPDQSLRSKISFGFDILGTHSFPTDIFWAKYVITADPFPLTLNEDGLSGRLNRLFLDYWQNKYRFVEAVDMKNGTVFSIYERILPADRQEVEYYLDAFREENEKFPDLYSVPVAQWMKKVGIS